MNDPKVTAQGEPQQGTVGQTSQGTGGTSKQDTTETLSREAAQKMVSDALAKQGRELKAAKLEAEHYKTDSVATQQQLLEIQRRIDEQAEEEAKGSPESLRQYQRDKTVREREARAIAREKAAEEKERSVADRLAEADAQKAEMAIISAAVEHHVDIGKLREKVQKFGLTTDEQISDLAETLAGQGTSDGDGKRKIPQGDSGRTIGGTSLDGLSPKELLETIDKKLRNK